MLLIGLSIGLAAWAQNGTTSPYSRFGYGILGDNAIGAQRAMGGVGYALHNNRQINVMNPASYASMDSLTFLFDIGLTYQNTRLRQNQIITWRSGKFLFGLKSTLQRYTPSYRIFLRTSAATRTPEHLNHQSSRHPVDQASSADRTPEEFSSAESVSLDGRPALPQAKVIEDLGDSASVTYLYQFSDGSMLGEVTSYTGL